MILENLTLPIAVIGIVQLVKLLGDQLGVKVTGAVTIIVAGIVGGILAFVDLSGTLVQGIYAGIVAVGGLTTLQKLGSVVSLGEPVDEGK